MRMKKISTQPYLSVIIPAYNEAKRIPLTLIDIDKHLERVSFSYEIIVVDNNSKDATREVAERFAQTIPHMRVVECTIQGKGAAVRMGMKEAQGQIRLFTDADNSTAITHFFAMQHHFEEGYDVVIGSRDITGSQTDPPQPWYRRILGDMGNIFIQSMLLSGIKDTQCGFKAFSAAAARDVFSNAQVNGWGFDVEVLALAKKFGYHIKEIPVVWVNDPFSHVSPFAYVQVLLEVVKIKLRLMRFTAER
jgi:dolichyl-phosphate beta-glucosyltransferase